MTVYYVTEYGAKVLMDAKYVEVRDVDEVRTEDGKWVFREEVQKV